MSGKKYHLHGGRKGAAFAVRVIPRAGRDEVVEVMNDGSVKIRLISPPESEQLNQSLIKFLAATLGVAASKIEIVAGESGRSKLVSVLDMDPTAAHERILANID